MNHAHRNYLISYYDSLNKEIPQYYDHVVVLNRLKEFLQGETNEKFHLFTEENLDDEIWEVLQDDLDQGKEVQALTYIYDGIDIGVITHDVDHAQAQPLAVRPSLNNTLFFYPRFQIALCKIPIFQMHEDYEEEFIFAPNEQSLLSFLEYIIERQREILLHSITLFTDEERGTGRKRVKLNDIVDREHVFLEENIKKQIYRFIDEFFKDNGDFYKQYGLPYKRGILLYGKPGNGKTTLVKSIASSVSAPVVYWQITEFTDSGTIQEVFSSVLKMAPAILVIEDLDSMPGDVRSFFLNTLDGVTSQEGVFLIGTTNYPDRIDPALMNRAGRFDRAYEIQQPNAQLRKEYLLKRKIDQFLSEEQLDEIVRSTEGFSFAQCNELYASIALEWHYEATVRIDKILKELQTDHKKGKDGNWTEGSPSVGFFA